MASASIKQINLVNVLEDIKRTEISTKKEWVNIEEKGVDKHPIKTYKYYGSWV